MTANTLRPVTVVTASAGTGKTYDLTSRINDTIASGRDPERIVACTFTIKAAEELRERARERLIAGGEAATAVRLLGARIGTINGVSGGLVKEFAFGLGLSPIVDIIDEKGAKRAFVIAADEAFGSCADALGALSVRFGYDAGRSRRDWRDDVNKIVELARANNLADKALGDCAERSIAGFRALVNEPLPGETAAALDAALSDAIADVLALDPSSFGGGKKLTAKTTSGLNAARELATSGAIEELPWHKWAKLAKLDVAVADKDAFQPIVAAAAAFSRHPRLLADVDAYVGGVFKCAAQAMEAYERHKRTWGLVDFVDQDRLALELLGKEEVRTQLGERVQSVFVDEFQDTSPLQLAVFIGLSQIAESSVWVGDPKQSIYGFRGTAPDLIVRVAQSVREATGGQDVTLPKNYRSRPGLIAFFNDAFGRTFESAGLPAGAVRIAEVGRNDLPGQQPPLAVWRIPGGAANAPRYEAIAAGVAEAVASGSNWLVAEGNRSRPLAPGDIAVLCRNNDPCAAVAAAIARTGLKVAIERDGLFGTPEARLALAALRWCADMRDSVALAELAHLLYAGEAQPPWFEASLGGDAVEAIAPLVPIIADLRAVATGGVHKTPLEFFDATLARGGVAKAVLRWGRAEERLLNLEQLRSLAAAYQKERRRDRAPTTVTDLCVWLADQEAKQPASRSGDAVTVSTYHGSKGLEWPFVVLTDLDEESKASAFGAHVMSDKSWNEVDWRNPLDGRWVRFWPWPLGAQKSNVALDVLAANSPEGQIAAQRERDERVRLLYVGATRARDYLVLAAPASSTGLPWLDELRADGAPAILVPAVGDPLMKVDGKDHPVRVFEPAPTSEVSESAVPPAFASLPVERRLFPPLAIRPSAEVAANDARIVEEVDLGARLPLTGSLDMNKVGEALHRFLAADDSGWNMQRRIDAARRLLSAWGVDGLDPRDVVAMSDRFRQFVDERWPNAILHREAPIHWRSGDRTLSGRLDVVVEAPDAIIVIDHKSFPGGRAQWIDQARKHAGQLRSYRDAVSAAMADAKPVCLVLHLPIVGEVLFIE